MSLFSSLIDIAPLDWLCLLSAIVSGGIVGLERQLNGKPVGLRTGALICVGVYTFVAIALFVSDGVTDRSRIIGQIVTGVGFLGAGVMLVRDSVIIGVTSAAAIWVLAAIGVVIGSGYPFTGVKLSVLTVLILVGITRLETTFLFFQRGVHNKLNQTKTRSQTGRSLSEAERSVMKGRTR